VEETSMKADLPAGSGTHVPVEVTVEAGKTYWWCACGLSKQQPFCDGSHKTTQITPLRYKATESDTKWFCVCKRTKTAPFCDGSHADRRP
jgi:CDGSH-type Zn-finger protein